jgi:hypothetical protein
VIYDSHRDYITGVVTATYEGDEPSRDEINHFCQRYYSFTPGSVVVVPPQPAPPGYVNDGWIQCHRKEGYFN